ncbi:hypothetical protein [Virgibacillus dakarensis]|uniref:hypothetical protein n=1 Tax=Virgibacillus dakarensis TaxID=1917889 RepID=UPI000B43C3CF|nr:hypothetical protein [Virgibacillus dakarensis]
MIPVEVENRIAKYFFHNYLPGEIMWEVEERLLEVCIWEDEKNLDHDELVNWALDIISKQLDGKSFK